MWRKPYYQDDAVTIYNGDCRDILPQLELVDLVLTDPPYEYNKPDDVLLWGFLAEIISRPSTNAAIFGYPEHLVIWCGDFGLRPIEWLVWWPTNAAIKAGNGKALRRESEHVAIFGDPHKLRGRQYSDTSKKMLHLGHGDHHGVNKFDLNQNGAWYGDVWTDSAPGLGVHADLRRHPNEKPVDVITRLISLFNNQTILDPFMGSGTTLRAAKDLGRKAIGIEIEEKYCEIAAKRMAQEVLKLQA